MKITKNTLKVNRYILVGILVFLVIVTLSDFNVPKFIGFLVIGVPLFILINKLKKEESRRKEEDNISTSDAEGIVLVSIVIIVIFLVVTLSPDETPNNENSFNNQNNRIDNVIKDNVWEYSENEDKINDSKMYHAILEAKDKIQLDFPYNGGQIASLHVRNWNGENNVMFEISKGQIVSSSFRDNFIKIKFGDNKAQTYTFSKPADGSSDVIFLDSPNSVIKNLKKASTTIMEVEFYQNGIRQIEFNTNGLVWNK